MDESEMNKYEFMASLGAAIIIWLFGHVKSFVYTTGMVWLICMCFEIEFKLKWATGIWLILILVSSFFESSKDDDKDNLL